MTKEEIRLAESRTGKKHWKRWGPYLSERAWGTVREDYSTHGNAWEYLPHDHARSRAYRWNEDGLAGISDRRQLICFALALWNERDPILKERIFGLTGRNSNSRQVATFLVMRVLSRIPVSLAAQETPRSRTCRIHGPRPSV